ncbi:MAG: hypothetical protein AAF798_22845, partial [Bacteroidota bacterium]
LNGDPVSIHNRKIDNGHYELDYTKAAKLTAYGYAIKTKNQLQLRYLKSNEMRIIAADEFIDLIENEF